jgi:hypothetical protein
MESGMIRLTKFGRVDDRRQRVAHASSLRYGAFQILFCQPDNP